MRRTTLAVLCLSSLAPVSAQAARVEIILDVSGSMRAKLGAETRIDAARKAIRATLAGIQPESVVGLRLYGHRVPQEDKAGSCRDSELVVPFQPVDKPAFQAIVDRAAPRGQTPLTYSLEQAARDFGPASDEERVIILVSDGEESCGGDPAAATRSLLAQGFKVKVHTIGFDVDAAARAQLEAISTASGGEYHDARNADALAESLTRLAQQSLLVQKADEGLGQPIRGGDGYETAVALQPGQVYRLDHHQRKDDYDYFYVEVKGRNKVEAAIETTQKSVTIQGETFREDGGGPYAGLLLQDGSRNKLGDISVIGRGERKWLHGTFGDASGRLYLLIGTTYGDQHKDARFSVKLTPVAGDAGTPGDAGATEAAAIPIKPGSYTGYLDPQDKADFFKFTADPEATYRVRVRPVEASADLELRVDNVDANVSKTDNGVNGNAAQVADLKFPKGGEVFVRVGPNFGSQDTEYSLEVAQAGGSQPTATASAGASAEATSSSSGLTLVARVVLFLVWTVLPFVLGLLVGAAGGYLLGRRRR